MKIATLLKGLSRRERTQFRAIAEVLFYDGETPVPPERLDWLEDDFADLLMAVSETTLLAVRAAGWVLEFSPLITLKRPQRLSKLPVEKRLLALQRADESKLVPLSMLCSVVKIVMTLVYFEHPDVLATTGFDGMCMVGPRPHPPSSDIVSGGA